jgi:hypothetical protein
MSLALHTFGSSAGRRNYREGETSIVVGPEDDGRWWADIESMAYGSTRESAIAAGRGGLKE